MPGDLCPSSCQAGAFMVVVVTAGDRSAVTAGRPDPAGEADSRGGKG